MVIIQDCSDKNGTVTATHFSLKSELHCHHMIYSIQTIEQL